jgi:RimJ/RimL family protein N-acetyltransferase
MAQLSTARLRLRPIGVREARGVVAGRPRAGSRWSTGYPAESDVLAVRGFLEHTAWVGDLAPFGLYQLVRRADGLVIGGAGFHGPPGGGGEVSVGYGVVPAARGCGYATEALRALLAVAYRWGLAVVRGTADRSNHASQRVMARVGMRLVAEDHTERHYAVALTG